MVWASSLLRAAAAHCLMPRFALTGIRSSSTYKGQLVHAKLYHRKCCVLFGALMCCLVHWCTVWYFGGRLINCPFIIFLCLSNIEIITSFILSVLFISPMYVISVIVCGKQQHICDFQWENIAKFEGGDYIRFTFSLFILYLVLLYLFTIISLTVTMHALLALHVVGNKCPPPAFTPFIFRLRQPPFLNYKTCFNALCASFIYEQPLQTPQWLLGCLHNERIMIYLLMMISYFNFTSWLV